jgi:mono/diheme cytochrome c family protein
MNPATRWASTPAALIGLVLCLFVAGNALGQGEIDDPEFRAELGRALYLSYCASCHGEDARGKGPSAEALKKPPADLTLLSRKYGRPMPREKLVSFIDGRASLPSHGSREMPVWGERLYENEPPSDNLEHRKAGSILLLIDYLESIQLDSIQSSQKP